jgi:membrane protease subunit (stomatin/prohibitin family)
MMALLDRVKFDGPSDVLVWKWPHDSLSLGAQVIVNESQEALFYKGGQALDLFSPGTHTLTTANLPFLQRLVNLPFGGKTPFSAEVYFINKSVALGQDWGTKTPFMILDPRYRVTIPLRAYGQFGLRVVNTREFVTQIAGAGGGGTRGSASADMVSKRFVAQVANIGQDIALNDKASSVVGTTANDTARYLLESLIVTCLQQSVGSLLTEQKLSVLDLPSQVLALSKKTHELLQSNFQTFGLELVNFVLESINFDSKDESVQRLRAMLDEAARLDVVGDAYRRNLDFYRTDRQFDVLEGAAETGGAAGSVMGAAMGIGMGFGVASPAGALAKESMAVTTSKCGKCGASITQSSKFCPSCGESLQQTARACPECSTPNPVASKFCSNCGASIAARKCSKCGAELQGTSKFCNECGEKV